MESLILWRRGGATFVATDLWFDSIPPPASSRTNQLAELERGDQHKQKHAYFY